MTKISAARAKKEYNAGNEIIVAQSKVSPSHFFGGWYLAARLSKDKDGEYDKVINSFRYYNSDPELGRGLQYWIDKKKSNPSSYPKGKFIKCKAVKFNKNGSISIKK